ncbi:MAG: hypothetical protein IT459_24055 [Planctomycetes bacterium]|nr:hypothetical protein [Planctomycetota bacterium]
MNPQMFGAGWAGVATEPPGCLARASRSGGPIIARAAHPPLRVTLLRGEDRGARIDFGIPRRNHALPMAKQSLVREFFAFIRHEKKWWMIPLVVVLLVVGGLILFAGSSPLAPFIYPLF